MNRLLNLMLFFVAVLPGSAFAGTAAWDRQATIDRKVSDFRHQKEDCTPAGSRTICTTIFYHYEIDEHGRLYFVVVTAYGEKDSESSPQPGASEVVFICQLDATLKCNLAGPQNQTFNLDAYAVDELGVSVHGKINPWVDPQKAELLLPQIVANADATIKVETRMMDDLTCYMFDFDALVKEFKINGRLIDDDSKRLLKPDACMSSFEDICRDPAARSNELNLAADAHATDSKTVDKFAINAKDIERFCNSIKTTKSAMLR